MVPLKRHLLLLVLGALLPLLAVAVALTVLLVREDRNRAEEALHENARLLAGALDAELNRSITAMQTLARNESLRGGDLGRFYEEAKDVRDALGLWDNVLLLSPTGEHLLNLLRPYGTKLPPVPNTEGPTSAARERKPYISNALKGRVETEWLMFMNYPVVVGDEVKYVLGVTMNQRYWSRWLAERAPQGSTASIVDRNQVILARTHNADRLVGQPVQPWFRELLAGGQGGTTRGQGLADPDVVVGFHRSEVAGWHVNVFHPGSVVDAPGRRTAVSLAIGVAVALAMAAALALWRAGMLTRGIRGLQAALEGLKGERPKVPALVSGIEEVNSAIEAARDTAAALHARQDEIEALQADLRGKADALSLAMRGGRMGAWSRNLVTGEVWWSRELEQIFGLPPGGFAGDEAGFLAYVHPDDRDAVNGAVAAALEARTDYAIEFRWRAEEGWRWMDGRGRAEYDDAGRPAMLYGVGIDITERKRAEDELRRLNQALSEADRRKDEFLATLAHELRNPLAPIRTAAEILKRPGLGPRDAVQAREIIERQALHMTRMVDDLLEVGRITHGELQLRKEIVEVGAAVRWAVEAAERALKDAGVALELDLPREPLYVDADPTRLTQILVNLLGNAAKFTPRGGHAWLKARRTRGGWIELCVRDDGIGIEPRQIPRLFEMFSQAAPVLERSGGGLGIGLALVRGLVERHGGAVEAKSDGRGLGAEFIVRLPAAEAPQQSSAPSQETPSGKKRVVVADDNRDAADSLGFLLRSMGHEVRVAYDGEQALAMASRFRPEAMVVDIGMPVANGYDVAARARASDWGRGTTLIALTGWGQSRDKALAAAAGFDHHLTKPVEASALEALLGAR